MSSKFKSGESTCEDNRKCHPGVNMPSSLVLDKKRDELVMASLGRVGTGGGRGDKIVNAKAAMALKSHSEAERRRRERINGHLSVLRSLVPSTNKLDKAALLAEVINHVKLLKGNATQSSKNLSIPSDTDEAIVELDKYDIRHGIFSIRASLSCEDRPDILDDLRQTIHSLNMKIVNAKITTLGGRIKNEFEMTYERDANDNVKEMHILMSSVKKALMSVLDRAALLEFDANKRRRVSPFESSSSSS